MKVQSSLVYFKYYVCFSLWYDSNSASCMETSQMKRETSWKVSKEVSYLNSQYLTWKENNNFATFIFQYFKIKKKKCTLFLILYEREELGFSFYCNKISVFSLLCNIWTRLDFSSLHVICHVNQHENRVNFQYLWWFSFSQ